MNVCELYIINSVSLRSIGIKFNIRIPKYQSITPFKMFLEKHKINPNSTLVTEIAYFELLKSTGKLKWINEINSIFFKYLIVNMVCNCIKIV